MFQNRRNDEIRKNKKSQSPEAGHNQCFKFPCDVWSEASEYGSQSPEAGHNQCFVEDCLLVPAKEISLNPLKRVIINVSIITALSCLENIIMNCLNPLKRVIINVSLGGTMRLEKIRKSQSPEAGHNQCFKNLCETYNHYGVVSIP